MIYRKQRNNLKRKMINRFLYKARHLWQLEVIREFFAYEKILFNSNVVNGA